MLRFVLASVWLLSRLCWLVLFVLLTPHTQPFLLPEAYIGSNKSVCIMEEGDSNRNQR